MLNRFRAAALCCPLALALGGCPTTPGTGPLSSGAGAVATVTKGVQTGCGYPVTQSTVSNVLAGFLATYTSLSREVSSAITDAAVGAICAGVAPLASGPGMENVRQGYALTPKGYVRIRSRK